MSKLALFGTDGKTGLHISQNLQNTDFETILVEVSQAGQERLKAELELSTENLRCYVE